MNQRNYIDIINEDTPCEGCIHAIDCATQRHACDAFALYVYRGEIDWEIPRLPTRRIYNRTMRMGDGNGGLIRSINKKLREGIV
jgi:hypothetical protein